jgi:hypothetical protein
VQVTANIAVSPDLPSDTAIFQSDTTVSGTATLSPTGDASKIQWEVTSLNGKARGIIEPNPADKTGATFSFKPDNVPNTTGSTGTSDPLRFEIKATYCSMSATKIIEQDEKEIIRQEYRDFTDMSVVHTCAGLCNGVFAMQPPSRGELNVPVQPIHFPISQIRTTAYNVVRGNPGDLADQIWGAYNSLINNDIQVQAMGTTGLNPTDVVVNPGGAIQLVGALLDTAPCNGASNPATCDDQTVGNAIVAGPNGIAETIALNQPTNYGLRITSAWRNPRRNLAVNGAASSRHLLGDAIDIQPVEIPPGKTATIWCILQTAADMVPGANGFTERHSSQQPCNAAEGVITHVHTQR